MITECFVSQCLTCGDIWARPNRLVVDCETCSGPCVEHEGIPIGSKVNMSKYTESDLEAS